MAEPDDEMRIAAFGDINIDVVLDVENLPIRGGEVFATRRRELLGGSAANTAVVLARLGFESAVMGAVGDDDAGHRALYSLGTAGVSTDLVSVSELHPTAMNTVMVTPDGERTMVSARGANVYYTAPSGWDEGVDWLHVSGYSLMAGPQQRSALDVITAAGESSIPRSLDVPVEVGTHIRSLLADVIDDFRMVSGSQLALAELTDSADPVEALAGGPAMVAATSGAGPLLLMVGEERISLNPPTVDSVDVTGAGDAFAAGLIAAGLSDLDPGPTAVLAAAIGAAATLGPGASGTLADGKVWVDLLDDDRWSDADLSWLAAVRSWVEAAR
ncbi:MAG: carbohydrate kinase family protein [Actinomycetota bacterium]